MSELFRVLTTDGRNRKVFEGTERSAILFVQAHFPRIHVEPGVDVPPTPDVLIYAPNNGGTRGYHGHNDDEHEWYPYEKDDEGWYPIRDNADATRNSAPGKATPTKTTGK